MTNEETNLVIFDGDCPVCNRSVRFIKKHQGKKPIKFISRYHQDALIYHALETESLLLVSGTHRYDKSTAALRIAGLLRFPWNGFIVFLIVPLKWRDAVYEWIARNRMKFSKAVHICKI